MARTFPPNPGRYDHHQLITQVSEALKAWGINLKSDFSLHDAVASALLSKAGEGERDQRLLVQYAFLKAWCHIWRIEDARTEQLKRLREPFQK